MLPMIKTEVPTTMALPIPLALSAKIAARQPSPPPRIVPMALFKPLLNVAPICFYKDVQ